MLILSRKAGQAIHIGSDIVVHFFNHCKGQTKVGIEAPDDVTVLRDELVEKQADDDYAVRVK